jgi:hypothetical protein
MATSFISADATRWPSHSGVKDQIVADKRCQNGHFIDESWDICPYCPPDSMYQRDEPSGEPAPSKALGGGYETPSMPYDDGDRPTTRPPAAEGHPVAPHKTMAASRGELDQRRYVVGWLLGLNGKARGEAFPIRMGRNVLGRARDSEVMVQDDQASSHHADLVYRPEERRYILMDRNSTNGTYVNGREIEPRRDLVSRDVVTIGAHRFLFLSLSEMGLDWDEKGELR